MYIEASPQQPSNEAWLSTSVLTGSTGCVELWYHMYGSTTGRLTIYLQPEGGQKRELRSIVGKICHTDFIMKSSFYYERTS